MRERVECMVADDPADLLGTEAEYDGATWRVVEVLDPRVRHVGGASWAMCVRLEHVRDGDVLLYGAEPT